MGIYNCILSKDVVIMGFYDEISKYYDYIFPVGQQQIKFISESAGIPPRAILDVACGSGGYSIELAKKGYNVAAVDLEEKMVEMAKQKAESSGAEIRAFACDMRELAQKIKERFDCIFCIGNSIVHIGSAEEITKALSQMNGLLEDDGSLVLQIINYDRILKYGINELPSIRNNEIGLEFVRKYEYNRARNIINFNTTLTVAAGNRKEEFINTVELLPLASSDMRNALEEAGFGNIEFYGDFSGAEYNVDSYMLVVRARR